MHTRPPSNRPGPRARGTVGWDGTLLRRESDPMYIMRRETDPTEQPRPDGQRPILTAALWLKIARGSLVLALIAAATLYVHMNPPAAVTATVVDDESAFVAPRGTLDMEAELVLVEKYVDTPAPKPELLPDPAAPLRMLDPEWNPVFSGG